MSIPSALGRMAIDFDHLAVAVAVVDPQASIAWYRDVPGFQVSRYIEHYGPGLQPIAIGVRDLEEGDQF